MHTFFVPPFNHRLSRQICRFIIHDCMHTATGKVCSCYNHQVKPEIIQHLIELNSQFYQTFALQFSATRQRLQPGVQQILQSIDPLSDVLDLGCGNGELAYRLQQQGHIGEYLGLDFSPGIT